MIYLIIFFVSVSVCLCAACCSGQVVKSVEAQTNKQEDKKEVPGEISHTQKIQQFLKFETELSFSIVSCTLVRPEESP